MTSKKNTKKTEKIVRGYGVISPLATAVWLVDNTSLTFKQIGDFCGFDEDKAMEAIKYYLTKTNRRVTIEYIMLKDVNDSVKDALGKNYGVTKVETTDVVSMGKALASFDAGSELHRRRTLSQ